MQIVTKDVTTARKIIKDGYRVAKNVKHEAHRRHRRRQRHVIARLLDEKVDADEAVFEARPGSGWDVA